MFGYVKACKPQLKIAEFELYRGVYCSLCRALGRRYGLAARMTLSYDFTFLALFIMALSEEDVSFKAGHCSFHPTKKRMLCEGEGAKVIDYAADVAMLLTYHKLSDTVQDERFFKRFVARVTRFLFKKDYKKAAGRCPREASAAERYMVSQRELELQTCDSVDRSAEPTALFLQELTMQSVQPDEKHREEVSRFGYALGRFIYLADAADDMEEDAKHGSFNPYLTSFKEPLTDANLTQRREYAAASLHGTAAVCAECYETFDIKRFDGILRNVLYYGLPSVIERIRQGKQEDKRDEQSL